MMVRMRRLLALSMTPLLLAAVSCSDPGSALSRAESTGVLTVGVVENPPRTVPADGGEVDGSDADLIRGYAESIGAHPSWQVGELDPLTEAVGRGEVDVIIGADEGADGLEAASGPDGAVVLVGEEEDPLRESVEEWLAGRD